MKNKSRLKVINSKGKTLIFLLFLMVFSGISTIIMAADEMVFYNFDVRLSPFSITLINFFRLSSSYVLKKDFTTADTARPGEFRCSFLNDSGAELKSVIIENPLINSPFGTGTVSSRSFTIRTLYDPEAVTLSIDYGTGIRTFNISNPPYWLPDKPFPTTWLKGTGSRRDRINFVIMGDGYTPVEMGLFHSHAQQIADNLFAAIPYSNLHDYINVYSIDVPSAVSGVSQDPAISPRGPVVDTYFDCTFFFDNQTDRLLAPLDVFAVNNVLQRHYPDYDVGIIIANSTSYGGAGGTFRGPPEQSFPTTTHNINGINVLIHELAHGFAKLQDEYFDPAMTTTEAPNMTALYDPAAGDTSLVPWREYIGTGTIGVFNNVPAGSPPGTDTGWYKPSLSCIMHAPTETMCLVCEEEHYDIAETYFSDSVLFEAGEVTVRQSNLSEWHTVHLQNIYIRPVVIMGTPSFNGGQPCVIRVKDVSSTQFNFQIDEWDYLDAAHASEDIGYMVIEEGVHNIYGVTWQAGIETNVGTGFRTVNLGNTGFDNSQTVLTQVATFHDPTAVTTRVKDITDSTFKVKLREEEAADNTHEGETVHYVCISTSPSVNKINGKLYVSDSVDGGVAHTWKAVDFLNVPNPTIFAQITSHNGGDPAALRRRRLSQTGVELLLQEEQSQDTETNHYFESVHYLIIEVEE